MSIYTYDHELITMTNQFLNTMSDIVIKRFNVHRQMRDRIKVRMVYAPKQRVLNDLLDRDQNLQLPVIAVQISGVTRDQTRVTNKLLGSYYNLGKTSYSFHEKTPLPVDVKYTVSIMTRYQEDLDQIVTHLAPYVNPYLVVSWRTPKRQHHEIRSKVLWDGSVNTQYPVELTSTTVARVIADLTFTFKGWLFQHVADPVGDVANITSNFFTSSKIDSEYLLDEIPTDANLEQTHRHTSPQPKTVFSETLKIGETKEFSLLGSGFNKIRNVYVAGCPFTGQMTLQTPFEDDINLSTTFSPFYGIKLSKENWSYIDDSTLSIVMPSATSTGLIDIIVENEGGYGKLSDCMRLELSNEFNPTTSENYTSVHCMSGIRTLLSDGSTPVLVDERLLSNGTIGADFILQETGDKILIDTAICV